MNTSETIFTPKEVISIDFIKEIKITWEFLGTENFIKLLEKFHFLKIDKPNISSKTKISLLCFNILANFPEEEIIYYLQKARIKDKSAKKEELFDKIITLTCEQYNIDIREFYNKKKDSNRTNCLITICALAKDYFSQLDISIKLNYSQPAIGRFIFNFSTSKETNLKENYQKIKEQLKK